jgi:DUF1680 family protein
MQSPFTVDHPYWNEQLRRSREVGIPHQWKQLESRGVVDNFRIAAGSTSGTRRGYCYADSELYKWYESVAREHYRDPSSELYGRLLDVRRVVAAAMERDGYIHTFNRIVTPGKRWMNLLIEHELYNHGHLIEALIADDQATGDPEPLTMARRTADQIVAAFSTARNSAVPGHQEIELALIRLSRATDDDRYRDMAFVFLNRRRTGLLLWIRLLRESASQKKRQLLQDPDTSFDFGDSAVRNRGLIRRFYSQLVTGRYHQLRRWRRLRRPVGHAVRFAYEAIALAMLARDTGSLRAENTSRRWWTRLVQRFLYVSGGVGALPLIEGFGRPFELPPDTAYCESCASIGTVFWSREMAILTGSAEYADLVEWELYNTIGAATGIDGTTYAYRNPLFSDGTYHRRPWFATACCPGNLSRLISQVPDLVARIEDGMITVDQYVGGRIVSDKPRATVKIVSEFPWEGKVTMDVTSSEDAEWTLRLRVPSWCEVPEISADGESITPSGSGYQQHRRPSRPTASGIDPRDASYLEVTRSWLGDHSVVLDFPMTVIARRSHPRVKSTRGLHALTRGPLLFCLEAADNPDIQFGQVRLNPEVAPRWEDRRLVAQSSSGDELILIPYHRWANRDDTRMRVWL